MGSEADGPGFLELIMSQVFAFLKFLAGAYLPAQIPSIVRAMKGFFGPEVVQQIADRVVTQMEPRLLLACSQQIQEIVGAEVAQVLLEELDVLEKLQQSLLLTQDEAGVPESEQAKEVAEDAGDAAEVSGSGLDDEVESGEWDEEPSDEPEDVYGIDIYRQIGWRLPWS